MEMRVEPKLSYAERLIISGSKRKIWFGYFLFALNSILTWFKESFISSILKGICGVLCISLVVAAVFGIIFLLTLLPAKIIGGCFLGIIGTGLLYVTQMMLRIVVKETVADLNYKANNLREATLLKLGPLPSPCRELYGPPVRYRFQNIGEWFEQLPDGKFEELQQLRREGEEQTECILKELENV